MKKFFVNVFATTGISLILLSAAALFFQAKCVYVETVFQVLEVNLAVHAGLTVLSMLELKSAIIEVFLHISLIMILLVVFGSMFHWFTSTPVWVLVIMDAAIYSVSILLNLFSMKKEAQEMNALIKERNG